MKGQYSIFQPLVNDDAADAAGPPHPERKGRSEELKKKQNEMIVHRYYYYVKLQGKPHETTLNVMENEVYLSVRTIINIIEAQTTDIKMLRQQQPGIKYFQNKYPHLVW